MRVRYRPRESVTPNRWMVSYLDVLTILLILFVAVAARAIQPPAPTAAAPPSPDPPSARAPADPVEPDPVEPNALEGALFEKGLDLHREPWGLVISLPPAVLFPSGDERIPESALHAIEEIAAVLRTVPNPINIAGNADSVPIHNRRFHNNWELSAGRGMALLDLLASKYGIDESRLSVTSYGSFRPRGSNDSPEGRAGNRRVEITVLDAGK